MHRRIQDYLTRTVEIRELSSPYLGEVADIDDYSRVLREHFSRIGELAHQNRSVIEELIDPILKASKALNEEEIEVLDSFVQGLGSAYSLEILDSSLGDLLTARLLEEVKDTEDIARLVRQMDYRIDSLYAMLVRLRRIWTSPGVSLDYQKKGFALSARFHELLKKKRFFRLPDEATRELVLIDTRYSHCFYEGLLAGDAWRIRNTQGLESMISLADDPEIRELVPNFDWNYHDIRTLEYLCMMTEYYNMSRIPAEEALVLCDYAGELQRLWERDPGYGSRVISETRMRLAVLFNRHHAGRMSHREYLEELLTLYEEKRNCRRFEEGVYANIQVPLEYMLALVDREPDEEQIKVLTRLYRSVMSYVLHLHRGGIYTYVLEMLSLMLRYFIEVPEVSFEEMSLKCMAALHPPTYFHSLMVAAITRCLTGHLLDRAPERFVGFDGCKNPEDVREKRQEIIDFAYHAALCHDVGKLPMIDTIFIYERRLTDLEFGMIKQHPSMGKLMLERNPSTRRFGNVAQGHHRWYDNSQGYPPECDLDALEEKVIIDIVECADCMDAATDTIGRSYSVGKTLDDFIEEYRSQQGTRYASYLMPILDAPEVYRDVSELFRTVREENYRSTYLLMQ